MRSLHKNHRTHGVLLSTPQPQPARRVLGLQLGAQSTARDWDSRMCQENGFVNQSLYQWVTCWAPVNMMTVQDAAVHKLCRWEWERTFGEHHWFKKAIQGIWYVVMRVPLAHQLWAWGCRGDVPRWISFPWHPVIEWRSEWWAVDISVGKSPS